MNYTIIIKLDGLDVRFGRPARYSPGVAIDVQTSLISSAVKHPEFTPGKTFGKWITHLWRGETFLY